MTVVGSVDIAVSLLDADYQRKKQAIAADQLQLQRPTLISLDASQAVQKLIDLKNLYNASVFGAVGRIIPDLEKRVEARGDRNRQQAEQELDSLYAEPAQKEPFRSRRELAKDEIYGGAVSAPSAAPLPPPRLQQPLSDLKVEVDNGKLIQQLSDARRSISEISATYAKVDLTSRLADRSISKADFDGESLAIEQGQSRARIEIAKKEAADIEQLLSRESSSTRVELLARLNVVRSKIATESLLIEKRRVSQVQQIEEEGLKDGSAIIGLISDARRRSLDGDIADQQRLQAAYGITVNQQQRQRQAIAQQSAALNTQIGLLERVAKAALGQTTELQNLAKLSADPKANRFTREESQRQVKELTGKDSLGELRLPGLDVDQSLLVRKQQQEDQVGRLQGRALAAQIMQKQLGLELDLKSESLSRARALQEQKIGFLKAQQNFVSADQQVQQAGFELDSLPKNGSLREQATARNKFENAKSDYAVSKTGLDISAQGFFDARSSISEFRLFAEQARKALGLQTDGSKGLFNLEDGARERRQSLELARDGIDPTRFNRRVAASPFTEQDFGDPNFGRQGFSGQGSNSQFLTGGLNLQPIVDVNERIFNQNAEVISVLGEIRSALTGRTEPTESRPPSVLRGRGI